MAAAVVALAGCSASPAASATHAPPTATTSSTAAAPRYVAYAAEVLDRAAVTATPDASAAPMMTLGRLNENGAPQTLLIQGEQRTGTPTTTWYRVLLPVRPNGTTGWIRAADVKVIGLPYRLEVHLAAFRLDVFDRDGLRRSITIGVGTDQTPTPGGLYYIKELLRPPDQNTIYGHYVFGLSGFSNVLVDWPGGGVLGIHGTNDPEHSLGVKVSHGCIRMSNADIESLAALLPLGTPVTIDET